MAKSKAAPSAAGAKTKDPHYRPDTVDPSEYAWCGMADHAPHRGTEFAVVHHDILGKLGVDTRSTDPHSIGNVPFDEHKTGDPNFQCRHCHKRGKGIRYFLFFLHKPTGKVVVFGRDCAERFELASGGQLKIERERDKWEKSFEHLHPEEYAFLLAYHNQREAGGTYIEFLDSLWIRLGRIGSLTDKQLEGCRKWMSRQQAWQGAVRDHVHQLAENFRDADRHKGEVVHTEEGVTPGQRSYISTLSDELGRPTPSMKDMTRRVASDLINALKAIKQAQQDGHTGDTGWRDKPATANQLTKINALMGQRVIGLEERRKAREAIDAGLTRGRASDCITWLLSLPEGSS